MFILIYRIHLQMVILREPGGKKQDVLRKNRNPERQYIFDKVRNSTYQEVYL